MQYTPNYNLITVEGTDVVNPLVQMNPNFTNIDAAMFANKQAVIGTASEITSGTVHSITRSNPDSNYFRFTATSNWNAGDSMSVDGVNVSVFLSDGTIPASGAYIINTEVLAFLSGTRVTLLTSANVLTAASDITYNNISSGLTANKVQGAIDELAGKSVKTLWVNPDASQSFANQDIDIITDDTVTTFFVEVVATDGNTYGLYPIELGGSAVALFTYIRRSTGDVQTVLRNFNTLAITGGYRVHVADGLTYTLTQFGSPAAQATSNGDLVPKKIFAI